MNKHNGETVAVKTFNQVAINNCDIYEINNNNYNNNDKYDNL